MSLLGGNANADMCTMHSYLNKYIYNTNNNNNNNYIITITIIIIIIIIIIIFVNISPCQYTGLTWAFQFYRGPRPILWKCPFGTLYKIKILTDTYIISPIKSQPASNPSMSSNPKTLQNCSAQVKPVQGISSKLTSIKLGPSKMAWS